LPYSGVQYFAQLADKLPHDLATLPDLENNNKELAGARIVINRRLLLMPETEAAAKICRKLAEPRAVAAAVLKWHSPINLIDLKSNR
jgi:hypothetical protein